ncbi:MAG TPA: hypothetical protein VFI31_18965 [Pirellulales bacterium]|nr:hypothetical protein [Pirellulales bacterium]
MHERGIGRLDPINLFVLAASAAWLSGARESLAEEQQRSVFARSSQVHLPCPR